MDVLKEYNFWCENEYFDDETRQELLKIREDKREIEERFYKNLEFGTGGLRGIIGAGTNRMNIYTVRKASQGLADFLASKGKKDKGIVIMYDSRHKSPEFALEAAKTFAGNGIKTYLSDELRPTPQLSFAVRHLGAAAGVVITASHNPKEYNGYKVYGEDGAQIALTDSEAILARIEAIEDITKVKVANLEEALKNGLIVYIGKEIDDAYIESIKTLAVRTDDVIKAGSAGEGLKIVYTPLHGTGNKPVRRILAETGFNNVIVVKEQELPDPDFSTVKYPNPEEKEAFKLAIELAKKVEADIIMGTDPDCDRVGVAVRTPENEYKILSGNQLGCLLLEFILAQRKKSGNLPPNGFSVKTIVTSECARAISENYKIELVEVLTGFKFIGEKIKELDEFGNKKFIFGFEESYGYLAGTYSRDKDGVVTCMLTAQMAACYKKRGMTLLDGLRELFDKYGYFTEDLVSFTLEGKEGLEKISNTMTRLRNSRPEFGSCRIRAVRDYKEGVRHDLKSNTVTGLDLPKSNVLYYETEDKGWFAVRPSGTEPKIKIYFGAFGESGDVAAGRMKNMKESVLAVIKGYLEA